MSPRMEDYLREVEAGLRVDVEQKRQIVAELRAHLQDKLDDHQRAQPDRDRDDLERQILEEFGNPRELALAYEPEGDAVLKNHAGEIVLQLSHAVSRGASYVAHDLGPRAAKAVGRGANYVATDVGPRAANAVRQGGTYLSQEALPRAGRAVGRGAKHAGQATRYLVGDLMPRAFAALGRGARKTLKGIAVTVAVLLVLSVGLGIWAFYEVKPVALAIAAEAEPVFSYHETCEGTPCNGTIQDATFYVHPDARQVRFEVSVSPTHGHDRNGAWLPMGAGSLRVSVADAEGSPRFERAFVLTNDSRTHQEVTWAAVPGNWSVSYEFVDFVGEAQVRAWAQSMSLPWNDL